MKEGYVVSDALSNKVEILAEKAENLSFCRGIKLLHIRNCVEEMLSFIGRNNIFEEYTLHDIQHIDKMLDIINWLIPDETKNAMTYAEWLMLTLAVYFHDLGMLVTKTEYEKRENTFFREYKENAISGISSVEYKEFLLKSEDHFLYQEFVRENHAVRIKEWILGNKNSDLGESSSVFEEVNQILENLDKMFRADLAMVCESHHKDDIENFSKYKVNVSYGSSDQEKVNLNYVAVILRIADLLHITNDRTPSIARRIINVSNPISVVEWEKQHAVKAVKPQLRRNEDGNIDEQLEKNTIEVTAYFDGAETAEAYFGLSAYLQYTRKELSKCASIINKAQKTEGTKAYKFPWTEIDESQVIAVGFETKKLQFTIAQESILKLLVGHTLYNDSSVVVRELVQNAIDAIKLQNFIEKSDHSEITQGKIEVVWNDELRQLSFIDNGTGMSMYDVENYLLKVGASKYRDESIKRNFPEFNSISHFGIGILTCFMIANDIDITTNSENEENANVINLRRVNGSYLLKKIDKKELNSLVQKHGTIITLHVRTDIDMTTLENDLKKWIILPEVDVHLIMGNKDVIIGYHTITEVVADYLRSEGIVLDDEQYAVKEQTCGNVTLAYAVRYSKYLSDWTLMTIDSNKSEKKLNPIGTCVEGIRVEFTSPGYKSLSIIALANIKNGDYQTNVARSAIELDANVKFLSDIYGIYSQYLSEQMESLMRNGYSDDWAAHEVAYLMQPLLYPNRDINAPIERDILLEKLAEFKCFILENSGERKVVSPFDISELEEVHLFESKMLQAAEGLLKEVKSKATVTELIRVVCDEDNFLKEISNVIFNYDEYNILHQYAFRNKEVSKLEVDQTQRRIHSVYINGKNRIWSDYKLLDYGNSRDKTILHLPQAEFLISGLKSEVGVETRGHIYIRSDSEINEYLQRTIPLFEADKSQENKLLLELFLSCIFNTSALENTVKEDRNFNVSGLFDDVHMRVPNELASKIWTKVSSEEFSKIILTKHYSLFSISNWSRARIRYSSERFF